MRKWLNRVLLGAGWCALAAGLVGLVLYFGVGQGRLIPVLLAAGASYLMIGALVGLLLFLIARGWRSAAVAGVVVATVLWTLVPSFVPDGRAASGTPVTVMQSNLLFGQADVGAVLAAVRDSRVDVLTLEEMTPQAVDRLTAAGIDELLPYHYLQPYVGAAGTGIYSRYPLRDTKNYEGFRLHNISAVMDHPQRGPVTVYAFHPVIPQDFDRWTTELGWIRGILDAEQGAAIVGADLNSTRDHVEFRELVRGRFQAAADQAGAGLVRTFPTDRSWGPVIGIDHVLVAGGTTEDLRALTIPGSDHRAVIARVWLS
ncbi:endonuclease/exonuclease/phosphatase family protein [Nocardia sp. NPDC052566]|uniref:endonuclease/exonuclease/phosphatase family protein n=1 Tax=Nocardia sp. NPDC052566 TaxID=3364330 RepID=UPI0037CBB371